MVGRIEIETPKIILIDQFIALRSKMYANKCGDDSKNKWKGICKSQSKNIKFEEYKKCFDDENFEQDCDKYVIRSLNHEMYLQRGKKSRLSQFDDERCSLNGTESKPYYFKVVVKVKEKFED